MDLDSIIYRGIRAGISKGVGSSVQAVGTCREETELLESIYDVQKEWQDATTMFEYAYEEKLVDYYTYRMKACEARYAYFLAKAKELGIKGPK